MPRTIFRNARVATLDESIGVIERADVLVDGDTIAEVAADIQLENTDVVEVQAEGMLLMPGMVDTHNHLWEHLFRGRGSTAWGMEYFTNIHPLGSQMRPEDIYAGVFAGATECLHTGVTTALDYNHTVLSPEHAVASVEALTDAGVRAVFSYDLAGHDPSGRSTFGKSSARFAEIEKMKSRLGDGGRVTLGLALTKITPGNRKTAEEEISFGRSHGLPMTFHNNTGGELRLLEKWGLLEADLLPAHGNWITDDDLEVLAAVGGYLSVTPEVESFGGRRSLTMTGRGHKAGVKICLGVDVPAMTSPGLITQMRYTFLIQRVLEGINERVEGHVPVARRPGVPSMSIDSVLEFGTVNGAGALGLGEVTGRIAPGMKADLVLIDARTFGMAEGSPAAQVLFHSSYGDVDSVMVDGVFRKRDGKLVSVDVEAMNERTRDSRIHVLGAAGDIGAGPMHEEHWDWAIEVAEH